MWGRAHHIHPRSGWSYVFGLATFAERAGLHSFARYAPAFFGEPRSRHRGPPLTLARYS